MTIIHAEAHSRSGRGRRRRTPVYVALGALVVSAGGVLVLLGLEGNGSAHPTGAPGVLSASQPIAAAASQPAAGAAKSGGTTPTRVLATPLPLPPAAAGGDHYARNVTSGATCAPAGARGFTARGKVVLCVTTSSDPRPRWRP